MSVYLPFIEFTVSSYNDVVIRSLEVVVSRSRVHINYSGVIEVIVSRSRTYINYSGKTRY